MSNYHSTDDSEAGSVISSDSHIYQSEQQYSLLVRRGLSTETEPSNLKTLWKLVASGFLVALIVIIAVLNNSKAIPYISSRTQLLFTSQSYLIEVAATSPDYGSLHSTAMLPWDAVLEPNREQTLSVKSLVVNDENVDFSDFDVTWSINDGEVVATGANATITMTNTGVFSATVSLSSSSSSSASSGFANVLYSYDFTVAVKYVRREVRALTDDDRTKFFDALYTVYTVDGDTGREKYGSKYIDASEAVYYHLNGAGRTDCDHWHDGAGLITHHMAYTLLMEQALQTIDASIAMPYWEYGMDNYMYDHWMDSPVFGSDWFGEASPTTDDHSINDGGRWTNLQMPSASKYMDWSISDEGSLNPFANAFGMMRGPWNNNPSSSLGRHNTTYGKSLYTGPPDCFTLSVCFESRSLSEINNCLNGATHGPVHIVIGGGWDPDVDMYDSANTNGIEIKGLQSIVRVLLFKLLWRMGYTRCPSSCSTSSSSGSSSSSSSITHSDCKCAVPDEYIEQYGAEGILKASNAYYPLSSYLDGKDNATMLAYLRVIEDPGVMGEMLSSAASYDPTFWPLHGAMERLLDLKRIYLSQGELTSFDQSWGFPTYDKYDQAAYLDGVCDWSGVSSNDDLTLPTCTLGSASCSGHGQYDLLEFGDFLNQGETYTNNDFLNFLHPWNESLPYTYDTFDFDYCADNGFPFTVGNVGPPKP